MASWRRTKIVCTIGPASEGPAVLASLVAFGLDVARLNLSHGRRDEQQKRILTVREVARRAGRRVAIMLDTRGPEVRVGHFLGGQVELQANSRFTLTAEPVVGTSEIVSMNTPALAAAVTAGDKLLLDDGNIALRVEAVAGPAIYCRVLNGGVLKDRKKVNFPGGSLPLPALTEEDREDIRMGVEMDVDFFAVSFVRRAEDVLQARQVIEAAGGDQLIIAKIENREGVDNVEEILQVADGLMVARGDLGVEIPPEEIPVIQKDLIAQCNRAGKPVITATQMLESMVARPYPTRAEASDVANAIFDGTDAVMLSAETATGLFPGPAVETMARIAVHTEQALPYEELPLRLHSGATPGTITDAISYATCVTARELGATALVTATQSGHTARMVSKYRPQTPIIAITPQERVARALCLVWGVQALCVERSGSTDEMMQAAIEAVLEAGFVQEGDLMAITAGVPTGTPGSTNLLKLHTIGKVLLRGVGTTGHVASGPVRVVTEKSDFDHVQRGDVLVMSATDRDSIPLLRKAAALITEVGGMSSHAAVAGLSLGIPVVVGVEGATKSLVNGTIVTVDGRRGLIYRGEARVL
ncbi:MAG TPA: pyruvate kinase [Firmicutes bacterium]|nr:pyruvate kinase [Bacillota bacterium]